MEHRDLRENTLCDIVMVNACHHTFVQTHRMHDTKSEPSCKLGTPVRVMCSQRFINCNVLVGMLMVGEAAHVRGQEACGKFLFFSSNFAVNLNSH